MKKQIAVVAAALMLTGSVPAISACTKKQTPGSYAVTAQFDPASRTLSAEMEVTVVNSSDNAWEKLPFELWPNAYREGAKYQPVPAVFRPSAYYKGSSYGGIEISVVEGCASWEVGGEDRNLLIVTPAHALYPDERASFSMRFTVTLAEVNHRSGMGERTVTLADFYPVLCAYRDGFCEYVYSENGDPFVSECADHTLELTVPEEYRAACGGITEESTADGKRILRVTAENSRGIAAVLSKDFKTVSTGAGGVQVEYFYLSDPAPERTLQIAAESLGCFSKRFGPYLYPIYRMAETDLPYGGMEYPMLSMLGNLHDNDRAQVVAHETAHQWWYAMVGSDQFAHAWMDEGLAEYSVALFFEEFPAYGDYRGQIESSENSYRAFFAVNSQLGGADTSMDRPLTDFSGLYEYRSVAYDKAVILFDRVRMVAGKRRFFSGLANYCAAFTGKIASPADLIASFHRAGANVEGLFDSFTEGKCVI